MTTEQQIHANELSQHFQDIMFGKYEKGAKEHGGNIWDMSEEELLDNALDEAVDQVVYLLTLKYSKNYK